MKKQAGFTLIELIMVIVILGILSAFALPRFADLSENAEDASLQGALASLKSTAAIVHASALANNENDATGEITMEGEIFALINGYPDAGGLSADTTVLPAGTAGNGLGMAAASNVNDDYVVTYDSSATTPAAQIASDSIIITLEAPADGVDCVAYEEPQALNGAPSFVSSTINAAVDACGTISF